MIGIVGIVLSLILLMYLAYRDVSVLVLAPLCAMLAVLFDGNLPVLAAYTQIFMGSVGQFVRDFFPLFLLGAIFGKLMEDSGAAAKIAEVVVRCCRSRSHNSGHCAQLRNSDLRRRVAVCGCLCRLSAVEITLSTGRYSSTTDSCRHRAGFIHIHDDGHAGDCPDSESDSHAVLSDKLIRGSWPWLHRQSDHVWPGYDMAEFSGHAGTSEGEGFGVILPSDDVETDAATNRDARKLPAIWSAFAPIICVVVLNFVFSQYCDSGLGRRLSCRRTVWQN